MIADDFFCDGGAEPRAIFFAVGDKRVEKIVSDSFWNARAVVGHHDQQVFGGFLETKREGAAVGHRLDAIVGKIVDNAGHPLRINMNAIGSLNIADEGNVVWLEDGLEKVTGLLQPNRGVDVRSFQLTCASGEIEQVMGHAVETIDMADDSGTTKGDGFFRWILGQHFRGEADDGHGTSEVVDNGSRHLADQGHFPLIDGLSNETVGRGPQPGGDAPHEVKVDAG